MKETGLSKLGGTEITIQQMSGSESNSEQIQVEIGGNTGDD
jgi:hypothetical protein